MLREVAAVRFTEHRVEGLLGILSAVANYTAIVNIDVGHGPSRQHFWRGLPAPDNNVRSQHVSNHAGESFLADMQRPGPPIGVASKTQ